MCEICGTPRLRRPTSKPARAHERGDRTHPVLTRRRAYAVVIAASGKSRASAARPRAPRGGPELREVEAPRPDVHRQRDVRLRPGPPECLHPAALRLLPDPDLLDRRVPLVVVRNRAGPRRGRDLDLRARDRPALPLAADRPARGGDRGTSRALPRVARPAREPRDPRPADRGGDVRPDAARGEPALGLDGGRARSRRRARRALERATDRAATRPRRLRPLARRRLGRRDRGASRRRRHDQPG